MGGSSGAFGQALVNSGMRMGGRAPAQGGAEYTEAPTRATYQPAFSSQQTAQQAAPQQMQQRSMSPLVQQQMMPQAPQSLQGLQGLMSQMMSRYQSPFQTMQRAPMPQYRSSALDYRPDMTNAQQNLSRVAKSVVLQQKEAAEAELAAMKEAQAAAQQDNSYYSGGG
jgi:hypothetical protein